MLLRHRHLRRLLQINVKVLCVLYDDGRKIQDLEDVEKGPKPHRNREVEIILCERVF